MSLRVTMFAVGLGASILLEFDQEGGRTIRVLADGGNCKHGSDIAGRLKSLNKSTDSQFHIDLIIGTHYDADHLDGLTEILKDSNITVSEIWLPPVADNTNVERRGRAIGKDEFLGEVFFGDDDEQQLTRYLKITRNELQDLEKIECDILQLKKCDEQTNNDHDFSTGGDVGPTAYFKGQLKRARSTLGNGANEHVPGADVSEEAESQLFHISRLMRLGFLETLEIVETRFWSQFLKGGGALAHRQRVQMEFAWIRQSLAYNAIQADSLHKLVKQLKSRGGIRIEYKYIQNGHPILLGWNSHDGRFDAHSYRSGHLSLTILSPTERLIIERRDKLPVNQLLFYERRLKGMSDSNQLSYVIRFDQDGQGVLIAGDSGFDGFVQGSDSGRNYDAALVGGLQGLSVVQVPHHGGINRHFYTAIDKAGFSQQSSPSFLLLSHEANSKCRPSAEFKKYMSHIGSSHPARLLFTSKPNAESISDFKAMIAQEVPTGSSGGGDVVLEFSNNKWTVEQHKVQL